MDSITTLTSRSHFLGISNSRNGSPKSFSVMLDPGTYKVIKENRNSVLISNPYVKERLNLSILRINKNLLKLTQENNYLIKKFNS